MITTKQILRAIGCPYLQLHKGDGYWYFAYDRNDRDTGLDADGRYTERTVNVFETESVYCMRLNDAPNVEWWAADGRAFVARVEAEEAERGPAYVPGTVLKLGWK